MSSTLPSPLSYIPSLSLFLFIPLRSILKENVDVYIHSPIRFHGVWLN
jgi:hypothetical protein